MTASRCNCHVVEHLGPGHIQMRWCTPEDHVISDRELAERFAASMAAPPSIDQIMRAFTPSRSSVNMGEVQRAAWAETNPWRPRWPTPTTSTPSFGS